MEMLIFSVAVLLYLLPSVVASQRKHRNGSAICIVNIFLGWTFLGWVICLAWALTCNTEKSGSLVGCA